MATGHIEWRGDQWTKEMREEFRRKNLTAAGIFLVNVIKADISQSGTLTYSVKPRGKFKRTIRNFTHSVAGNPPYMQTGRLRSSIAWEFVKGPSNTELIRVGAGARYGFYLEKGTRKMAARPFIEVNLRKHQGTISRILTNRIGAGGLPAIVPNQSRSGYLGAGARRAGYL